MKKIIVIIGVLSVISNFALAEEKCSDLPGFKQIGKDSAEYIKCLATKGKKSFKLNTDSKLKNWITGKEKFKVPNPMDGISKIGKAVKPSVLDK
tara:strand:- start:161 stop:442 length:282 start_codon:yes stop_codon:yes gene_type:complete